MDESYRKLEALALAATRNAWQMTQHYAPPPTPIGLDVWQVIGLHAHLKQQANVWVKSAADALEQLARETIAAEFMRLAAAR